MKTLVLAKVVLFRDDGKILVLRRSDNMRYRPGELDVAGGMIDEGEGFHQAAVREVLEETGLQITTSDLQLVFVDSGLRNDVPAAWLFFLAHAEGSGVEISHEHSHAEWMELDQAISQFEDERQRRLLEFIRDHNSIPFDTLQQP